MKSVRFYHIILHMSALFYYSKYESIKLNDILVAILIKNQLRILIFLQFGILCDENEYKLALVGTINNIGGFVFMPLTGMLSDK